MSELPLVSVIIPLYNAEKYISATLESVINQTYQNLEAVIIDDGSKDQSALIVQKLISKHPNIIRYHYQENQGVSVARNKGIEISSGTYIAFLDSDDIWHPEKIERQVNSMIENSMEACYCGFLNLIETSGEKIKQETMFKKGDITKEFLTHQIFAQTSTWIIKKSILKENNIFFTPGANWAEDLEFIAKVVSIIDVCYVDDYLTEYRVLPGDNLSSKFRDYGIKTEKELAVFNRIKEWIQLHHKNSGSLVKIIDTYIKPHIIIDSACIYFKLNKDIETHQCKQIKEDLNRYAGKIYYQNGKKSLKLLLKLLYVRLKLKKIRFAE